MLNDLRYALRQLAKRPGFTAMAVLILALGLGANTTIFTLVDAMLLRPPEGVADPAQLIRVNRTTERTQSGSLTYPDYAFYRDNARTLSGLAAYSRGNIPMTAAGDAGTFPVSALLVSGNFFEVLGVRARVGRFFRSEEDRSPGAHPVVVLSHAFWQRQFGGDPTVVSRLITLNGHAFTVVGVAAPAFRSVGPAEAPPDVWVPLMMQPVVQPDEIDLLHRVPGSIITWIEGLGRLAPGVSLAAARADLVALSAHLAEEFPEWSEGSSVALTPHFQYAPAVRDRLVELSRMLAAVVAIVLLIACANLAILLLARASARQKEVGVRLALGAGRWRITRQLLVEGLVLALAGAIAGFAAAMWSAQAAARLLPVSLHVPMEPDLRVFGFTVLLAVVTAVVFGLVPAWRASRPDLVQVVKGTARPGRRSLLRSGLVVTQVALALLLVSGAGLFVRSLRAARAVDVGFATSNRLLLSVNLRNHGYGEAEGKAFTGRALEALAALPGVASVTTAWLVPLGGGKWTSSFQAEGVAPPAGQESFDVGLNAVGPGYFHTMGIPILAGREFTERDADGAPLGVIVNETMARTVWGAASPVGRVIDRGDVSATVVGVAQDARYYQLGEASETQVYLPHFQFYQPRVTFVLHTHMTPASLAGAASAALRALDPALAIGQVRSMGEVLAERTAPYRVSATLVGLFGALALVLAAVGLYGVLSYLVVQRTRELGIRMALGARRDQVAAVVLGRGLRLVLAGAALGAVGAWLAAGLVRGLLFGVSPRDPATFAVVLVVLVAAAVLASYLPARQAARIDPVEALRYE